MKILGIETSCDETSCSVVDIENDVVKELATVTATSADIQEKFGGVVPEVAARKQTDFILPVLQEVFKKADTPKEDVDAIAVTVGPGLSPSLLVGITAAKALALSLNKPVIPVNHLLGHIYANFINLSEQVTFPAVCLVVSGGHTDLVLMRDHYVFDFLGGTLDDAAGEAFDKTARLLGISNYNGGAALSKKAASQEIFDKNVKLPRPMINTPDYDFSFSGLKTAVRKVFEDKKGSDVSIAKEFEQAVIDVLLKKTIRAIEETSSKTLFLGGGVSANALLRSTLKEFGQRSGTKVFFPDMSYCGDNACYIATAGYFSYKTFGNKAFKTPSSLQPLPSLGITDLV